MIKKSLLLLLIMGSAVIAFPQNKDIIIGKWLNGAEDAHILIYQNSGKYHGRLIWLKNPNDENGNVKLDKWNPNINLSKRPVMGVEILKNFTYQEGIWEGGTIYDPKTGKTYDCKISMLSRDNINVRGFVGIAVLGRTESWTRVR